MVRLTGRPDMTLDVYRGRKTVTQKQQQNPEDIHSKLILFSLQLALCRVAAVKCLPVHHHRADYIFSGPLG